MLRIFEDEAEQSKNIKPINFGKLEIMLLKCFRGIKNATKIDYI